MFSPNISSWFAGLLALKPPGAMTPRTFRAIMVATLTVLLSANMIALTAAKSAAGGAMAFDGVLVTLMQELLKLSVAYCLLIHEPRVHAIKSSNFGPPQQTVAFTQARLLLQYAVPAVIYCFDNNFQYVVLNFLEPAELAVLWNFKIFATTLLLRFCLDRHFVERQWLAMFLLLFGCMVTQMQHIWEARSSDTIQTSHSASQKLFGAVLALLGSSIAAFGNVYCEWLVKKDSAVSLNLQNVRLYSFGVILNCITLAIESSWRVHSAEHHGAFAGFNRWVWAVVVLGTMSGLAISFILRYVDNIAMVFSHSLAMLVVPLAAAWLFHEHLSISFILGGGLVVTALLAFYSGRNVCDDQEPFAAAELSRIPNNKY